MYFDHVDWGKYFVSPILRVVHRIDRYATLQDFGDIACAGKARLLAAFDRAPCPLRVSFTTASSHIIRTRRFVVPQSQLV